MPQSEHWAVPWVVEIAGHLHPKSVFDFGVGMGQFGLQLRQTIDIGEGRLRPEQWQLHLEGVDIFEDYRNPIWSYYYNHVHVGDGLEYLRQSDRRWDLILMCDVIEHFERDRALEAIDVLRSHARSVIITTPHGVFPQGCVHGNEAERHLSEWWPADFEALGASTKLVCSTFLAVFSDDAEVHQFVREMPALFRYTGRELMTLTRQWIPRMLRSRLSPNTSSPNKSVVVSP
jgi:hypothetical protein